MKPAGTDRRALLVRWLNGCAELFFAAFLMLALTAPAWRVGPFTWLPLARRPLEGEPTQIGLLSLLPLLISVSWVILRLIEQPRRPWRWGRLALVLPLAGLTALILTSLEPTLSWRTLVQTVGLGLFWWVYLYTINEQPGLVIPLSLIVLVQGSVAVGQFLLQSELGLAFLGEPPLDPRVAGTSILVARGEPWLRGYGLTGHPNALGALLAILLLMLLPSLESLTNWRRGLLLVAVAVGTAGLLITFSRTAWLAFGCGLVVWLVSRRRSQASTRERPVAQVPDSPAQTQRRSGAPMAVLVIVTLGLLFVLFYRDLVGSRLVYLDTPIEATSLFELQRDAALALDLSKTNPVRGVGAGNYLAAASAIQPGARVVHNVPLLVAAELGVIGLLLLVWLAAAALICRRRGRFRLCPTAATAPWLAMLVAGLFDVSLWLTGSWHAALLIGLLVAWQDNTAEFTER